MSDVSLKDAKALAVELVDICLKQHEQIKGEISQPTKLSAIFAQHRINGLGARSGTGSYVKLVAYEKNSSNTIVMSISEGQAEELMNQLQGVLELPMIDLKSARISAISECLATLEEGITFYEALIEDYPHSDDLEKKYTAKMEAIKTMHREINNLMEKEGGNE